MSEEKDQEGEELERLEELERKDQGNEAISEEEECSGGTEGEEPEDSEKLEEEEQKEEDEPTREELFEEIEELESSLKKVMADFDNYRKRMNKEKQRIRKLAAEDMMCDLLEVLDDFERALEEEDIERDGIEMIYKKFFDTLKEHGLEEIEENEDFDPNYHECVQSVEAEDVESDKIIEVFQKGYKLNDKVIRPSRVKVAK